MATGQYSMTDVDPPPTGKFSLNDIEDEQQPASGNINPTGMGEIPLTSHMAATEQGLNRVGQGALGAVESTYNLFRHPIDTARGLAAYPGNLMQQVTQIPGAIRDINKSPDPAGFYLQAAGRTAGESAGQALTTIAASELPKAVPSFERAKGILNDQVYSRAGSNVVNVAQPAKTFTNLLGRPVGRMLPSHIQNALGEFISRMSPGGVPYNFQDLHELTSDLNSYIFSREGQALPSKTRELLQKGVAETRESLNSSAESAGVGKQWRQFNREYSQATKIAGAANWTGGTLGAAAGGALGYEGAKAFGMPGIVTGTATGIGAGAGAAAGKAVIGGMVRGVLSRDITPPPGSIASIMQAAKAGTISPGKATTMLSNLGVSTKVNVPYWKAKTYPNTTGGNE